MAVIEFQSQDNPQHVFAIFPSALDEFNQWTYTDKAISPKVAWADCMNDYPTRHTPWGIVNSERLEEFLYSLGCYMKENGCNPVIEEMWPKNPNPAYVLRFHQIKHNAAKTVYFNRFGETTTSAKKGKERGWKEVPEWATGDNTPAQIYGMWEHGQHNSLYAFHFLRQVGKLVPEPAWKTPERFLPHGLKDREIALTWIFSACQEYVDAYRATTSATSDLDTYKIFRSI